MCWHRSLQSDIVWFTRENIKISILQALAAHQCTQISILRINCGNSLEALKLTQEWYLVMERGIILWRILTQSGMQQDTAMEKRLQEGKDYCTRSSSLSDWSIWLLILITKRQNLATLVPYHKNIILLSVGAACHSLVRWNMWKDWWSMKMNLTTASTVSKLIRHCGNNWDCDHSIYMVYSGRIIIQIISLRKPVLAVHMICYEHFDYKDSFR